MMKSFSLTIAATLLFTSPVLAADRHAWPIGKDSVHLYYSDLDMNTVAGRATLLARVEKAARRVCEARLRVEEDECVVATLAQAAAAPRGEALKLALSERDGVRMAGR
jgi:UrcA family protein